MCVTIAIGGLAVKPEDKRDIFRALGEVGNIGFSLASSTIVGLFLGRWIDRTVDIHPWASIFGIVLGLAAGFWSIYKRISKLK